MFVIDHKENVLLFNQKIVADKTKVLMLLQVSHWPIKLQHKLFSPWKVHVRMHKTLVYELKLIARVSSPSTRNNIVVPGWGEFAGDNYWIASKRKL